MYYYGTGRQGAVQSVGYSSSIGATAAVGVQTQRVRIVVTTDAYVSIGSTSASTTATYIVGLQPEYWTVTPGQTISAVQVSASGTLNVTEVS